MFARKPVHSFSYLFVALLVAQQVADAADAPWYVRDLTLPSIKVDDRPSEPLRTRKTPPLYIQTIDHSQSSFLAFGGVDLVNKRGKMQPNPNGSNVYFYPYRVGREIVPMKGHKDIVTSVSFGSKEKRSRLVSGSLDGTVRVWSTDTKKNSTRSTWSSPFSARPT